MPTAQKFITEANKQQVIRLLGWSELEYCNYQEEVGLQYMRKVLETDEQGISYLSKNELFWKWWVNHWNYRDAEFLIDAKATPAVLRPGLYRDLNSIEGFEFYPHSEIMEVSYNALMSEMFLDARREVAV